MDYENDGLHALKLIIDRSNSYFGKNEKIYDSNLDNWKYYFNGIGNKYIYEC